MTGKIFRSVFFTSMLTLLLSLILIAGILFSIFDNQLLKELKSETETISYIVETNGKDAIYGLKSNRQSGFMGFKKTRPQNYALCSRRQGNCRHEIRSRRNGKPHFEKRSKRRSQIRFGNKLKIFRHAYAKDRLLCKKA